MNFFACFFFSLALLACSTNRPHRGDDHELPGPPLSGNYIPSAGVAVGTGSAAVGIGTSHPTGILALTGVSLATNPDYYRKNTVSGRCVIATTDVQSMQTPCNNVTIYLLNPRGQALAKTVAHGGEFAFRVNKGETYGITVQHPKYRLEKDPMQNLRIGDSVLLKMVLPK